MRSPVVLSSTFLLLAFMSIQYAYGEVGWTVHEYVNPREERWLKNILPGIELFPSYPGERLRYAEDDGGYTFNVYFKKTPKILWQNSYLDYEDRYAAYAHNVVKAWNASLLFAVENYEWGRHLSKLRLKFYTDENVSQAPHIDVVIDASKVCPYACALFGVDPLRIEGNLDALPHELGHTLGLGHAYPKGSGYDWRGWLVGGGYPGWGYPRIGPPDTLVLDALAPPDTFVLYALAVRWEILRESTRGDLLKFPPSQVIRYEDVAGRLGGIYSSPGLVWAYFYTVLKEGEHSTPYPHPLIRYREGIYDKDLCTPLFAPRFYDNGTALLPYKVDLQKAILDRLITMHREQPHKILIYSLPLKFFTGDFLERLKQLHSHSLNLMVEVNLYDSVGPALDSVSGVSYKNDTVCLKGLRERVLAEVWLGRAYRVVSPENTEPVMVEGWSTDDGSWVLRGSVIYFRPLTTQFSPMEGVRYVWRGVNETLRVEKPVDGGKLFNRLWKRQYLVEVDSPYQFEGAGWYDAGSKVAVKPAAELVDLDNGTRLVFKGFEGYGTGEIVADSPLKLKPVWERLYKVVTTSRYVVAGEEGYFREGETVFTMLSRGVDFGNGSRVELANITVYGPSGEVVAMWERELGGENFGLLQFVVDRPVTVRAEWRLYHRLTVTSPVNSYEVWLLNGSTHRLDLPERRLVGSDELMVLKQVFVNGRVVDDLELTVTSPTSVEAVYQRRLATTIFIDAGGGRLVEPEEVVLARDGETETYRPPFTFIGEGVWRVVSVTYMGGDVTADATLEVNIAGMKTLPSRLRTVKVSVVDFIGMPVPYTSVTTKNAEGVTDISGTVTLPVMPPWDLEVTASNIMGSGATVVKAGDTAARITAGISPYTMFLVAVAATAGVVVWRRKSLRR